MNEVDKKDIIEAIYKSMASYNSINPSTHTTHHEFVDECIVNMKRRRLFWEAIRKQVTGWGIIMVLSGIGFAVWQWFDHFVHRGQ